jgi:hypothetical protein
MWHVLHRMRHVDYAILRNSAQKVKSFGYGKGNDARIVIRLRSSAQKVHACVPKRTLAYRHVTVGP